MTQNNTIKWATSFAVLLALFVVMLGAYTRLTDAGLGCPDWPGCYGQIVLPHAAPALEKAQTQFPQIPIEPRKAWTEMAHRYAAGSLALLIVFISFSVLRSCLQGQPRPWRLPLALVILVFFQAALGMWTVTLKLLPVVVMGHLLGGVLIVACLARFRLQISPYEGANLPQWRFWFQLGFFIVLIQIALGGWVSSNYAGISCVGFPMCNGAWLPELHFFRGFNLFSAVGTNYQGGVLDNDARITIQMIHRLGALVTACYLLTLSLLVMLNSTAKPLRWAAFIISLLVVAQVILGIFNVIYLLPIQIAVAHNGVAALLLACVFSALYFTSGRQNHAA